MFEATIFLFSFIPLLIFITLGIPVIIGILVYRDANKRVDCSPWLWALIAALVPSFIGLIIYAIIRRDYPLKTEYQSFTDSYEQTSYEANFDQDGNPIPVQNPNRGFPTWAKVLLIVAVILVLTSMIAGCSALISGITGYHIINPGQQYYMF